MHHSIRNSLTLPYLIQYITKIVEQQYMQIQHPKVQVNKKILISIQISTGKFLLHEYMCMLSPTSDLNG